MSPDYDSTADGSNGGNSHRSRYGIDKLREDNYPNWKWNCQGLLEENEVWEYVKGDKKKPALIESDAASVAAVKAWETKDRKALRIIGFTVIDELQGTVREAQTSKEAWDELEQLHAPTDRQRRYALNEQLRLCKMSPGGSLIDHERNFSGIIEALRNTGKVMDKEDVITTYLLSLSEQ